uniref:Secreted protein n=1 Tax=Steinernema glaseri TaxID=37863 RepID=A0A1I7YMV6_9BILA
MKCANGGSPSWANLLSSAASLSSMAAPSFMMPSAGSTQSRRKKASWNRSSTSKGYRIKVQPYNSRLPAQ